ncbi:helix-turn-helix domain-containing protein [Salinarimonas sp. NSM]|uniref:helix-turn-helix domain-containing protein n=1 Tax=Salinarimonas sp. NSM TaxID=3458003 RepID=UPI004036ADBC
MAKHRITSEQLRAARALLRWEQRDLARESGVSHPTIARLELQPGPLAAWARTSDKLQAALEKAGVEFVPEEGEKGEGVRFRERRDLSQNT